MNRGRKADNAEHDPITPEEIAFYMGLSAVRPETLEESAEDE